jgi:hypothetical protein
MQTTEARKASRKKYELKNPKKIWAKYANRDARKRAVKKNVPFSITAAYVYSILTDQCPIYGTEFNWMGNGGILPTSPSLDRIDPAKGYVEGNLIIISSKANNIKSAYKAADLYKVADWLYEIENKGITNGN